jgi:hypothetical protein
VRGVDDAGTSCEMAHPRRVCAKVKLDDVIVASTPQQASRPSREWLPGQLKQRRHNSIAQECRQNVGREDERPNRHALTVERPQWECRVPRAAELDGRPRPGEPHCEPVRAYPPAVYQREDGIRQEAEYFHNSSPRALRGPPRADGGSGVLRVVACKLPTMRLESPKCM